MKLSKGVKWNTRVEIMATFVYGDEGLGEIFQCFMISLELEESMVILLYTLVPYGPANVIPFTDSRRSAQDIVRLSF